MIPCRTFNYKCHLAILACRDIRTISARDIRVVNIASRFEDAYHRLTLVDRRSSESSILNHRAWLVFDLIAIITLYAGRS